MKKFLLVLMICAIIITLAACNGAQKNNETKETTNNTTEEPVQSEETTEKQSQTEEPTESTIQTEETTETTAQTEETTETVVPSILIAESGKSCYKIIYPEKTGSSVKVAAIKLRKVLANSYSIELEDFIVEIDSENQTSDGSESNYEYEILVGMTNREESIETFKTLKYNDFIIKVCGTKVVILGGSDDATTRAIDHFMDNYISGDSLKLDEDFMYLEADEYSDAVTLLGQDLSNFTVVYDKSTKYIANVMCKELGNLYGSIISTADQSEEAAEYEIIIGCSSRGVTGEWGYDDFTVSTDGKKIYIGGGSHYAVGSGARNILKAIKNGTGNITQEEISVEYVVPDRSEYIKDISKFTAMHWDILTEVPEWMTDFDEKVAAMKDPTGRLMSCLHRGDAIYYPENSIEGLISSINMGADMVEIDVRRTKDGVLILLHDTNLSRTTNADEYIGRPGFPNTNVLTEWTYAQIQHLCLKEGVGGQNAKLTPYKIPTFEEVIQVCSERIFVRIDKIQEDTSDGVRVLLDYESELWPIIDSYKAYTTVLFTWHKPFTQNNYALTKQYKEIMTEKIGRSSISLVGVKSTGSATKVLDTIANNGLDYCVRLTDCNFSKFPIEEYLERAKDVTTGLKGKARMYIDAHNGKSIYETEECFKTLKEAGINILLVDKGFDLCKYIAKTETATQK